MIFGPHHALLGIAVVYGVVQDPAQFWSNEMVRTAVVLAVWELCGVAYVSWRGQISTDKAPVAVRLGPHHILLVLIVAYGLSQKPHEFWSNELVRVCAVLVIWEVAGVFYAYVRPRPAVFAPVRAKLALLWRRRRVEKEGARPEQQLGSPPPKT